MKKITIELDEAEMKELLRRIYLGHWMLHSLHMRGPSETEKEMEQEVYGAADKIGLKSLIEYSREDEEYHPTPGMEEAMQKIIGYYDVVTGMGRLSYELARRHAGRIPGKRERMKAGAGADEDDSMVDHLADQYRGLLHANLPSYLETVVDALQGDVSSE